MERRCCRLSVVDSIGLTFRSPLSARIAIKLTVSFHDRETESGRTEAPNSDSKIDQLLLLLQFRYLLIELTEFCF
ncbi:hypothetical protein L1887_20902 [Cichorium endivia]|nr:hypothetical protein L1887_20902 [Cichorium endivia]